MFSVKLDSNDCLEMFQGSFQYDLATRKFNLQWPSILAFENWIENEQQSKSIELKLCATTKSNAKVFSWRKQFVCGGDGTGGTKPYERHPEWN